MIFILTRIAMFSAGTGEVATTEKAFPQEVIKVIIDEAGDRKRGFAEVSLRGLILVLLIFGLIDQPQDVFLFQGTIAENITYLRGKR